jgi:Txe/YoeB family toxin of Txe-Axe toxin-antitoxin module
LRARKRVRQDSLISRIDENPFSGVGKFTKETTEIEKKIEAKWKLHQEVFEAKL